MDNIINYIKSNKWALLFGVAIYLIYLQFIIGGNRICDCVSVEKHSTQQHTRVYTNRFYHK